MQSIATQKTVHLRVQIIYGIATQKIQHCKALSNNAWLNLKDVTLKGFFQSYMALECRKSNTLRLLHKIQMALQSRRFNIVKV
jgi:hypothetical protein